MRFPSRWPRSTVWLIALLALAAVITACRRGSPILDPTPRTADADGTISGTVRGPEGTTPVGGRVVHAVNLENGARQRVTTNEAGGYTFKVPPGRYRVELALLPGEVIVEQPDVLEVSPADLEVSADFTVAVTKLSKPRIGPLRPDDGLGPPSA